MQITYTQHAYADLKYTTLERIKDNPGCGRVFLSDSEADDSYWSTQGYSHIGTAEVVLTIHSQDQIVMSQLSALNAQLQAVRAESQQKENAILLQISKLQALTLDPNTVEA